MKTAAVYNFRGSEPPSSVFLCVYRTRAVVVEFSLYNINTNLLAVLSFLIEFPVSDRALSSLDLHVITLWPFTGLDLQLLLTVSRCNSPDGVGITYWHASLCFLVSSRSSSSLWFYISWYQASQVS